MLPSVIVTNMCLGRTVGRLPSFCARAGASWRNSLMIMSLGVLIGCDVNSFLQQVSQARTFLRIFSSNLLRPLTQLTEP